MHLLLMFLKAIERICTQENSNAQSGKKASNKGKKGNKRHGTEPMARVPKKACTEKHCNLCKKHGARILCTTRETVVSMSKMGRRSRFLHRQDRQKETQSCKELFCTDEQDIGKAQEGN